MQPSRTGQILSTFHIAVTLIDRYLEKTGWGCLSWILFTLAIRVSKFNDSLWCWGETSPELLWEFQAVTNSRSCYWCVSYKKLKSWFLWALRQVFRQSSQGIRLNAGIPSVSFTGWMPRLSWLLGYHFQSVDVVIIYSSDKRMEWEILHSLEDSPCVF